MKIIKICFMCVGNICVQERCMFLYKCFMAFWYPTKTSDNLPCEHSVMYEQVLSQRIKML